MKGNVLGCGGVGKDVWGVEKCGRVYGVSGEGVRECIGRGSVLAYGERMWGGVGKCVRVWGPNTLPTSPFSPHLSHCLPLPSPHPNTLSYTSLLYLFPHLAPHPNTFSYYPHISPHLLKVWRSYHVTKFLWRSYHVAKLLATVGISTGNNLITKYIHVHFVHCFILAA